MIDEGPQLARIRYEASGHYYGLKLSGEAKRGVNNTIAHQLRPTDDIVCDFIHRLCELAHKHRMNFS
jgi:hypothetical protein